MNQADTCLSTSIALLSFALLALPRAVHADLAWHEEITPHFTVYAQSDKPLCADQVRRLESLQSFLLTTRWAGGARRPRIRIILFSDEKSFVAYRRNPGAAAFYKAVRGTDYLVMPQSHSCLSRAVLHEYVHSVFHYVAPDIPLWLAEGLAEVYSSTESEQGKLVVGTVVREHLTTLQTYPLNLEETFSTVQDSPSYSVPEKMRQFYAASWAATHMMLGTPKYTAGFPQFLEEVRHRSTVAALQAVYGQNLPGFVQDLKQYLQNEEQEFRLGESGLYPAPTQLERKDVSELEMLCILSELTTPGSRTESETESRLSEMSNQSVPNPNAEAALAFLALRHNQPQAAYQYLRIAVLEGLADPEVLLKCLELQFQLHRQDELTPVLLRRVKTLQPIDDNMRFRLGRVSAITGEYGTAISLLHNVHCRSDQQFDYLYTLAYCLLKTRRWAASRSFGVRARELAQSTSQREAATKLLQVVDIQLVPQ